jgi:hypothetical protein
VTLDTRTPGRVDSGVSHLSTAGERPIKRAVRQPLPRPFEAMMEDLEDLELEDMKALGLPY